MSDNFIEPEKMQFAFANIEESVIWIDHEGKIIWCNTPFESLIQVSKKDIINKSFSNLVPLYIQQDETLRHVYPIEKLMQSKKNISGTFELLLDKKTLYLDLKGCHFHFDTDKNTFLIIIKNITDLKRLEYRFVQTECYDYLTHLPNRREFEKAIKIEISSSKRQHKQFALLVINIDNFKNINNTFGNNTGDMLLKQAAERLRGVLRYEDFLARFGKDEYVVIISDINDFHDPGIIAKRLLEKFREPFTLDGNVCDATLSIGIAIYPDTGEDEISLVKNAQSAMLRVKEESRNACQYFSSEMEEINSYYLKTINYLRNAIQYNEFYLFFQPRYQLKTGSLVGIEALLRWKNADLGIVMPRDFIPIAEKFSLIADIDDWMLESACRQYLHWFSNNDEISLSVNISPLQLIRPDSASRVEQILTDVGISPTIIEFELSEKSLIKYLSRIKENLHQLNQLGITLAIDDFGASYSSLADLKNIPVSILKIEQSLLKNIIITSKNSDIVKSIINMSKSLGVTAVQKGIEDSDQLEFLLKNDCAEAQGNFLCPALSVSEFTQLLKDKKLI